MVLSDNLFNLTQTFISPDVVKKFSGLIGESEDRTKAGLKSAIPTLIKGIAEKGTTPEGAETIVNFAKNHPDSANDVSTANLNEGNTVLHGIFGSNLAGVVARIGNSTGLTTSSITKMLGLAAPLVMGAIGTKVKKDNLNAAGLMGFFNQQRSVLGSTAPRPLGGIGVLQHKNSEKTLPWFLLSLLLLTLFAVTWWYIHRGDTARAVKTQLTNKEINTATLPQADVATPAKTTAQSAVVTTAATTVADLNDLNTFLKNGDASQLPKRFAFENLKFDSSKATLVAGSEAEIDTIAKALLANPTAKAKVEGYTDNSGNARANQVLSEDRAKAVKAELVSRGVAEDRIVAVGFGSANPIAGNETIDGRAQNRRIEFIVTSLK